VSNTQMRAVASPRAEHACSPAVRVSRRVARALPCRESVRGLATTAEGTFVRRNPARDGKSHVLLRPSSRAPPTAAASTSAGRSLPRALGAVLGERDGPLQGGHRGQGCSLLVHDPATSTASAAIETPAPALLGGATRCGGGSGARSVPAPATSAASQANDCFPPASSTPTAPGRGRRQGELGDQPVEGEHVLPEDAQPGRGRRAATGSSRVPLGSEISQASRPASPMRQARPRGGRARTRRCRKWRDTHSHRGWRTTARRPSCGT